MAQRHLWVVEVLVVGEWEPTEDSFRSRSAGREWIREHGYGTVAVPALPTRLTKYEAVK